MSTHTITVPDDLSGLDPDSAQTLLAQIDDHIEPLWAVRARVEQIAQAPACGVVVDRRLHGGRARHLRRAHIPGQDSHRRQAVRGDDA